MNRNQFLRRSFLFTLAAAGLPGIAKALQGGKKVDEYKMSVKPAGEGERVYRVRIEEEKLKTADASESIRIVMEAAFYKGYSFAADETGLRKGIYTLQLVGVPETIDGYMVTKWKALPKPEGQDVLKGRLGKTVVIKLRSKRHLMLEFSDADTMRLDYYNPDDSAYDDCFLTTACIKARDLPDDCWELTSLRQLRDVHMKPTPQGNALIEEYYRIAPGIVQEVSTRSNRQDIWNLVFEDMVVPVVALTEAGRLDEAVSHYAEYATWMKQAFTPHA
jgi:hypothetical protein